MLGCSRIMIQIFVLETLEQPNNDLLKGDFKNHWAGTQSLNIHILINEEDPYE